MVEIAVLWGLLHRYEVCNGTQCVQRTSRAILVCIFVFCGLGFSCIRRGWLLSVRFLMFWYLLFCVSHCITVWICSYSCCVVVFVVCVFPVSRCGSVCNNIYK